MIKLDKLPPGLTEKASNASVILYQVTKNTVLLPSVTLSEDTVKTIQGEIESDTGQVILAVDKETGASVGYIIYEDSEVARLKVVRRKVELIEVSPGYQGKGIGGILLDTIIFDYKIQQLNDFKHGKRIGFRYSSALDDKSSNTLPIEYELKRRLKQKLSSRPLTRLYTSRGYEKSTGVAMEGGLASIRPAETGPRPNKRQRIDAPTQRAPSQLGKPLGRRYSI